MKASDSPNKSKRTSPGPQGAFTPAELKKLEEKKKKRKPRGIQLTSMPNRKAFEGALAHSSTTPIKKAQPKERDGIQLAGSHYKPDESYDVYEAELPKVKPSRRLLALDQKQKDRKGKPLKLYTGPKNLASLVETIKSIYVANKPKKKKSRIIDRVSKGNSIGKLSLEEVHKNKEELIDDKIEVLHMRLYGNQVEEMYEFVGNQKKCEKELVVEKSTIPKWVAAFWKIRLFYEFMCTGLIMLSVFYSLYAGTFRNHSADIDFLEWVGLVIEIDVIIRLVVELWRNRTRCHYEVFTVNYTFFLALCDVIACFPWPLLYIYIKLLPKDYEATLEDIRWFPKFLYFKVFHAFRMSKIFVKLCADMNIRGNTKLIIELIRALIRYLLTIHGLSCVIFFTGEKTYLDMVLNKDPEVGAGNQYVTFLSLRSRLHDPPQSFSQTFPEPIGPYVLSLYFVVQTISTVGLGDIFAVNNLERFVTIIMMMVGAIWISGELAYVLGTFFTDLDASRYMMFFRVKSIKIHLQNYQVSNFICTRVENYYRHLWRYRKGIHEVDLSYLPHCVQEELKYDICQELFHKSSIFRGLDETFLMVLAKSVKVSLVSPHMILFERGNITKRMYFILQGEIAVAAGLEDDFISAIHRAGCLIGEINLFMALPYEQTVYTKTPCTLMTITKKSLMLSLQDFPHIFAIMRERVKKRRERYREAFNYVNINPNVQWMYPKSSESMKSDPEFPVVVRNMKGLLNRVMEGNPLGDENEQVIIDMPCNVPDLRREVAKAYRLVSVPRLYYDPGYLLTCLNAFLMVVWVFLSWVTPYCWAFDDFNGTYFPACNILSAHWGAIIICIICVLDFAFELFWACPSTGTSFKIKDGLAIRIMEPGFYCDLLSIFPFELIFPSWIVPLCRLVLKHWKINRFWNFLDERFPLKIFFVRLGKMTYYLVYLTYIFGVILLCLTCQSGRGHECNDISFFNPSYPLTRWERVKEGQTLEKHVYVIPLVYAASLLTSVGFANIFPQTLKEVVTTTVFMILGHFFVSYILAQLTSALSARLTPKLLFHQKLLAVETFVKHNGLSLQLLQKLIQHYDLQHQYVSGCSLPEGTHLMYDAGKSLLEDVFLVEGEIFFEGVPAFSKISSQAIIDMSRLMRRFVVPPGIVFVNRGEVRRILYVIVSGSVALYQHDEQNASAILTATGHFGLRDLLFGEPYPYEVRTLGYTVLYALDYSAFYDVLGDDDGLAAFINEELSRREKEIGVYLNVKIHADKMRGESMSVPSWIEYPEEPNKPIVGSDLTFDHFERPFYYFIGSSFIRENTMPSVLHPAGVFVKVWQVIMGLAATANLICLITELFMGYKVQGLRYFEFFLDFVFCADIYLKFHFGYYSPVDGRMCYHPVKTWTRYIFNGTFFFDIVMVMPLEMIIMFTGATDIFGYGHGHAWYTKLRWIRFLRCYKFCELYVIVHRIFDNRTIIMFVFYLTIAVILCYILSAVGYIFACPIFGYAWMDGDEDKMPVCTRNTWVDFKRNDQAQLWSSYKPMKGPPLTISDEDLFHADTFVKRVVLGLYYVGQILMVIGFGDLNSFRKSELHFMLLIALLGFIICQAIISDITSAQIDTDEIRAINREKLERLAIALTREGAQRHFLLYVRKAFRLSWSYAKGLQPNDLFSDLHPTLHNELLAEYIGDVLDRVPIFVGFNDAFILALKAKLKIEYYPKGSTITRHSDLDYKMYIIVKGDVWITDKENRWLCTLSTGESLGEMGLVYAAKKRFTAYAATNVQLLVLEAFEFALLLEKFPLTKKQILKSLLDYKRETYLVKAWKWRVANPKDYHDRQAENTEFIKKYFTSRLSHIPVRGFIKDADSLQYASDPAWYRQIIGYGCDEITECWLYFLSETGRFNFVIHPNCKLIELFRYIVQLVRFLAPIIFLFHYFFYINLELDKDVLTWTILLTYTFTVILWVNIALNFFIAVEVAERQTYCIKLCKIMKFYLFRPQGFLYDAIVCFPYDLVFDDNATPFMFTRILLSIKFFGELWKLKKDIEVSTMTLKLIISISFLLYLAHFMACLFFSITCPEIVNNRFTGESNRGSEWVSECQKNGWLFRFRIEFGKNYEGMEQSQRPPGMKDHDIREMYEDTRPSHWYMVSLYWVMAVLTTCGFGDITPVNLNELAVAVFCIFFGSLFLSIMLGNITVGLTSRNKAKFAFLGPVEKMLEYLEIIGLSKVGRQTLGAYCSMTWNNCRAVNYNDMADILPLYVQQDVYLALYHNYVTNCLFFGKNYGMSFVRAVCPRLRHYMFLPGMRIANEMEPGFGIYIVMRGSVTSFQQNPNTGEYDFMKKYEERQVFGRIPALFPGALYNKSYRAEEKTEVLLIYHADMRQLLIKYPRWKIFLRQIISREYSHFAQQTCLKDITHKRLDLDEKLTKNLTQKQFREGASFYSAQPPDRSSTRVKKPRGKSDESLSRAGPVPDIEVSKPESVKSESPDSDSGNSDGNIPETFGDEDEAAETATTEAVDEPAVVSTSSVPRLVPRTRSVQSVQSLKSKRSSHKLKGVASNLSASSKHRLVPQKRATRQSKPENDPNSQPKYSIGKRTKFSE